MPEGGSPPLPVVRQNYRKSADFPSPVTRSLAGRKPVASRFHAKFFFIIVIYGAFIRSIDPHSIVSEPAPDALTRADISNEVVQSIAMLTEFMITGLNPGRLV